MISDHKIDVSSYDSLHKHFKNEQASGTSGLSKYTGPQKIYLPPMYV